jgi:hypothetical protein
MYAEKPAGMEISVLSAKELSESDNSKIYGRR